MSTSERRTLLAETYRKACAGCEKSIRQLRELTSKHGIRRISKCIKCGCWCVTHNLDGVDARCHLHRKHMLSTKEMYKTLIAGSILMLVSICSGADIKLAWDPSPTESITNYVLYANTNAITQDNYTNSIVRVNVGTNLTCTVEDPIPTRWWFAASAMKDGLESDLSNIVEVEVPKPPSGMRTIVVQWSGTLSNFTDVGFFRLRIP